MKKYLILTSIGALTLLNQSFAGPANSVSGILHATVMPVSLTDSTVVQGFDFPGIIIRGVAGSVTLDPIKEMMTANGGVGLTQTKGQDAYLKLSTEPNTNITLTLPETTDLNYTTSGLDPLTLTNITCYRKTLDAAGDGLVINNSFISGSDGRTDLYCGATLNIPASAVAGDVSGTVVIGIAY